MPNVPPGMHRSAFARVVLVTIASLGSACPRSSHDDARPESSLPTASAGSREAGPADPPEASLAAEGGLAPLTDARWLEPLDLPDGEAAFVSVPLGTTVPRPVVVAVHGAGDRPEWACGGWRGVTDAYPFIVCPRGSDSGDGRFHWKSPDQIRKIVALSLPALHARFGPYVDAGPLLYAGFSLGAIHGARIVRDDPTTYPLVMLSEGGYGQTTSPAFARAFKRGSGRRVLFGCSTGSRCVSRLRVAAKLLESAGVEARVNDAGVVGHNLNAEAVASLKRDWGWLIHDDPRWDALRVGPAR